MSTLDLQAVGAIANPDDSSVDTCTRMDVGDEVAGGHSYLDLFDTLRHAAAVAVPVLVPYLLVKRTVAVGFAHIDSSFAEE